MAKRTKEERLAELLAEVESKKIDELKRTNERLLRQIERLKDRNADLKESVYRAITDGINTLSSQVKTTVEKMQKATEEICASFIRHSIIKITLITIQRLQKKESSNMLKKRRTSRPAVFIYISKKMRGSCARRHSRGRAYFPRSITSNRCILYSQVTLMVQESFTNTSLHCLKGLKLSMYTGLLGITVP